MSKAAHHARFTKRTPAATNAGCNSGAFYVSPKAGDNIDTSQTLKIQWDTSLNCFSSQGVDIYLYAPYTSKGLLRAWGAVSYSAGSFETELQGSWWNSSTKAISLNLAFVESGSPIFTSPVSQGPIFSATFNTTDYGLKHPTGGSSTNETVSIGGSSSTGQDDGGIFQVIGNAYRNSGLPKGSIAAAVIIPLLVVGLGIFAYIRWQRKREAEKRKRWSAAVDKRMSSISEDWKTLPPNAQSEAIRQSIAIMRNSRASMARMSQVYAEGRPSSTFTVENGGVNAAGVGTRRGTGVGPRQVSMGPAQLANRKSAISFADGTRFSRASGEMVPDVPKLGRPSTDSRPSRVSNETQRGRASRAFHTAAYPDDFNVHDFDVNEMAVGMGMGGGDVTVMSPTQKGGPAVLGDKDIKPLDLSRDAEVLPALNMMSASNDLLFLAQSPMSPSFSPIAAPPAAQLSSPTNTSTLPSTLTSNIPANPAYGNVNVPTPIEQPLSPTSPPPPASPFSAFMRSGPTNNNTSGAYMSPDAMLKAYAARDKGGRSSPAPGTPMEALPARSITPSMKSGIGSIKSGIESMRGGGKRTSNGSGGSGSLGGNKIMYPALDAPAAPERIPSDEGRVLYQPGQGQGQNGKRNTVASQYSEEDAYGGFGFAN